MFKSTDNEKQSRIALKGNKCGKNAKIQAEIVKKKRGVVVISWMQQISNAVRYPYLTSAMILVQYTVVKALEYSFESSQAHFWKQKRIVQHLNRSD